MPYNGKSGMGPGAKKKPSARRKPVTAPKRKSTGTKSSSYGNPKRGSY